MGRRLGTPGIFRHYKGDCGGPTRDCFGKYLDEWRTKRRRVSSALSPQPAVQANVFQRFGVKALGA